MPNKPVHFTLKWMSLFMALYILNLSVDAPDAHIHAVKDNLSINDQESVIELIVEKVLDFDNAIPEYDDDDTESSFKKEKSNTFYLIPAAVFQHDGGHDMVIGKKFYHYIENTAENCFEIPSPPPDFLI
jgi:hypothetical protein